MMWGLYHCVTDMDGVVRSANSTAVVPCIPLVPITSSVESHFVSGFLFYLCTLCWSIIVLPYSISCTNAIFNANVIGGGGKCKYELVANMFAYK